MAQIYTIDVSGKDAVKSPKGPVEGLTPVGPDPDDHGLNGKDGWFGKCDQQPGKGTDGKDAGNAPPAVPGANGGNCAIVTLTIEDFSGAPLTLKNVGGSGADAVDGGTGGSGTDGTNAGKCTKYCTDPAPGGIGGKAGRGADAGLGGKGGNSGDVHVRYGTDHDSGVVDAYSTGGQAGRNSNPGAAGGAGKGGLNSDGTTYANSGDTALSGKSETGTPIPGVTGKTTSAQSGQIGSKALVIQVTVKSGG